MRTSLTAAAAAAAAALLIAGCAGGPPYRRPEVAAPASFKEAPQADATWYPAAPADALDRGPWWRLFDDPVLSGLVEQVQVSNQNVALASANYAQAQALVRQARATLFPSLGLDAGVSRSGSGSVAAHTTHQASLVASWEPDLWGALRDAEAGAEASLQESAAQLAGATLSAQAALATDYFALREADHEIALLGQTVEAYERALTITRNQYAATIAPLSDVLEAQTQLESARASLAALRGNRAQLEHAIALLTGKPPAALTIEPTAWREPVPALPAIVPSELLQRRPDIAAAERAVAVANAEIGIARTAYFPSLSLTASVGGQGSTLAQLFSSGGNVWSLGLSAAQTLFDAGATAAKVDSAKAQRDAAVASYRQSVLAAFVAIEDQLAELHALAQQQGPLRAASEAADRAEQLMLNQYREAQVPYTSVVTTQVTALSARRALSQLVSSRQAAAVALIQAMGGGWHAPPSTLQPAPQAATPPAASAASR